MKRILKALAILFVVGAVLMASAGVTLAATVVRSGFMTVQVHDRGPDGVHLYLPVPAALVDIGLGTLPLWMPREELAQVRREIGPWGPALRAAARAFDECPDAVLVDVVTDSETVRVERRGRWLEVAVDSEDTDVRVKIPANTMSRLLNALTV
jgi:hypothetical protein